MTIRLAPKLVLPDDAVTQTFGVLAKRGAGKSSTAAVMAEEMHAAGLPFVVVDPVGAWWGLRSSSDGKGTGLSVPIFGGYRGDVPLEPQGAQLVADLIVEENLSAVLDVSAFNSEGEKRRFLAAFAERLYLQKGKPGHDSPLHLFLEEADDYIPQRATGDVARCLGAFERIVKRGRARGLGVTMITQRSAALNKDVLTQIETLIVLRTTSPQDRAAIGLWVKYHGQSEEILASLSGLADGEAWVWSPWLDLTERVQIRRRKTFDSGATPGLKAKRAVTTLADVDLDSITAQMKDTIERAKADDPVELKKRIRELERTVTDMRKQTVTPEPVIERVEVAHVPQATLDALHGISADAETLRNGARSFAETITEIADKLQRDSAAGLVEEPATRKWSLAPSGGQAGPPTRVSRQARPRPADASSSEPLGKGERTVMAVLRQWPEGRTYNELAFLAGYSANASTLGVILSKLRKAGYIEPGNQPIRLTAEGVDAAGGYAALPTGPALLEHWRNHPRMGKGEQAVLEVLVREYPTDLSHEELANLAGYSPIASTLGVILSKLRKLGVVDKRARRLSPEFAEAIAA